MISRASVSMSKRAPKALAMRVRRASQPSIPSSTAAAVASAIASAGTPAPACSPIKPANSATSAPRTTVT